MSRLNLPSVTEFTDRFLQSVLDQLQLWANGQITNTNIGSGAAITPDKLALTSGSVAASGQNVTTEADITGCTATPGKGVYWVQGVFDVSFPTNTSSDTFSGILSAAGTNQAAFARIKDDNTAAGPLGTTSQTWIVTLVDGDVIKLRGKRTGSTGTCTVGATHTTMTYVRIG